MPAGLPPTRSASASTLVLSGCSDDLRARLAERGYRVRATPLGSFLRSGGGAFCLTLRLDRRSASSRERNGRNCGLNCSGCSTSPAAAGRRASHSCHAALHEWPLTLHCSTKGG